MVKEKAGVAPGLFSVPAPYNRDGKLYSAYLTEQP